MPRPKGKTMKRMRCPDCGGELKKMDAGHYICQGDCSTDFKQLDLWEGQGIDEQQTEGEPGRA